MENPFDLTGRVAVVTGGSRGLGAAIVRALAKLGADVVVTSRKIETCEKVAAEVEALGRRAIAHACHVGRWDDLQTLFDASYRAFGKVDILVNNAGTAPVAPSSVETSEDLIDRILAVNFKGPFRLAALFAERMRADGGGSIINISSTGSLRPEPEFGPYAAAKAALNAITKAQALEFGPSVRVNAILAGPFWTDMAAPWREQVEKDSNSAVGRIGKPDEIASAAVYLASPASSYTTGSLVTVDGGLR